MAKLRLQHEYTIVIVLILVLALSGRAMASRVWVSLGFVAFHKGIISGQVDFCRGKPNLLDSAQRFAELALYTRSDTTIHEFLGKVHLWGGEKAQTVEAWKKTEYPIAHFIAQARHYHQQGHYRCALDQYNALILLWPNSSLPWYYMGETLRRQADYKDALAAYDRAAGLNNFQGGNVRLGDVYLQKGEILRDIRAIADAYEEFSSAVSVDDFSTPFRKAAALYKQGEMLVWMGRDAEAIDSLHRAIQIEPDYYNVYSLLGVAAYNQGDSGQAKLFWQKAIKIEPKYIWPYLHLARMYTDMSEPAMAVNYYHKVLELNPDNQDALNELSKLEE